MAPSGVGFDEILEQKIKISRYQFQLYFFTGLLFIVEGADMIALSLTLPIIALDWGLSKNEQVFLGSILFLGILFGSLVVGKICDRYGRRMSMVYISAGIFVAGMLSFITHQYFFFVVLRVLFGGLIGVGIPLVHTIVTEITPAEFRGRAMVVTNALFSVGKAYGCLIAWFTLENLTKGNWRMMTFWCCLPSLAVWAGAQYLLYESPRFLISVGRVREAVDVLNKIGKINDVNFIPLDESVVTDLEAWRVERYQNEKVASYSSLFEPEFKMITTALSTMWFSSNFIFYGMLFILPYIFAAIEESTTGGESSSGNGLEKLLITIMGEMPAIVIAFFLIETKAFGRKNSLAIAYVLTGIFFIGTYVASNDLLVLFLFFGRLFTKLSLAILVPFTAEIFHTTFRATGIGFVSGFGRLGPAFMPYIGMHLLVYDVKAPLLGFGVISLISCLAVKLIPYETRGQRLDETHPNSMYVAMDEIKVSRSTPKAFMS